MTKGNIIDLIMYRNQRDGTQVKDVTPLSDELKAAIETLIDRLRASDPIQRSG